MDENQIQELQSTSWFNKHNHDLPKKAMQFLVSLSLLSFLLLSCSSSPSSHFFHYLKLHYSALLFPILSQALDRKYIFLICNGIVAVLVRSLSFTTDYKPSPDFTEDVVIEAVAETEALVDDKESAIGCDMNPPENVSEEEVEEIEPLVPPLSAEDEKAEVEESEPLIPPVPSLEDEAADEEAEAEESGPLIPPPSAEDVANEVNVSTDSTEELNRKIEEFIRKMKEELRIEAEKQLVAV